jgi:hypothetical protein
MGAVLGLPSSAQVIASLLNTPCHAERIDGRVTDKTPYAPTSPALSNTVAGAPIAEISAPAGKSPTGRTPRLPPDQAKSCASDSNCGCRVLLRE